LKEEKTENNEQVTEPEPEPKVTQTEEAHNEVIETVKDIPSIDNEKEIIVSEPKIETNNTINQSTNAANYIKLKLSWLAETNLGSNSNKAMILMLLKK
jgi:hypothetical protein